MGFRLRSERGDTIIEVLIAVAVVSSVLAISYSIMNRNLQTLRDNQERSEASKLAQAQIERLKTAWENSSTPASFAGLDGQSFCMTPAGTPQALSGSAPAADAGSDDFSQYPPECRDNFYHIAIRYNSSETSYRVSVRWDSLNSNRSEVVMGYRLQ